MQELYYTAQDLAAIISSLRLGAQEETRLLNRIWQYDRVYLVKEYRENQRKLILDVFYWVHYFTDKTAIDVEFPAIQKDCAAFGNCLNLDDYIGDFSDLDLFFKSLRIKILYLGNQDYSKLKLRTLLRQYGYHRRSQKLMQYIKECTTFYHIQPYVRGGIECDIGDISIDEMIMFRVL